MIVTVARICGGAASTIKPEAPGSYKEVDGSRNSMGGASIFRNPNGSVSFKVAVKGNASFLANQIQNMLGPYIVEQTEQAPSMEVKNTEVNSLFS